MTPYRHEVRYYECDRMGVTHHSNYVRIMEEARLELLDAIGCGYRKMEDEGVISPVLSVDCNFKKVTTYMDEIAVDVRINKFTGVRLGFQYEMKNAETNAVVCTAVSEHCFVNSQFKPINLKKARPDLYDKIIKNLE